MAAQADIRRAERFIEEQHVGIDGERPRHVRPLPHAAGKLRGVFCEVRLFQADGEREAFRRPAARRLPLAPCGKAVGDIVRQRHPRQQARFLEHHRLTAVSAQNPPLDRLDDAGGDLQEGRLAAAGRAEQRHGLALADAKVEILEEAAPEKGVPDAGEGERGALAHRFTPQGRPALRQRSAASRTTCSTP